MIAGLPLDAWVLLVVAVGLGLGLELAFVWARRRDGRGPTRVGGPAGRPDARGSTHGGER